jgi:hypothetical protein
MDWRRGEYCNNPSLRGAQATWSEKFRLWESDGEPYMAWALMFCRHWTVNVCEVGYALYWLVAFDGLPQQRWSRTESPMASACRLAKAEGVGRTAP